MFSAMSPKCYLFIFCYFLMIKPTFWQHTDLYMLKLTVLYSFTLTIYSSSAAIISIFALKNLFELVESLISSLSKVYEVCWYLQTFTKWYHSLQVLHLFHLLVIVIFCAGCSMYLFLLDSGFCMPFCLGFLFLWYFGFSVWFTDSAFLYRVLNYTLTPGGGGEVVCGSGSQNELLPPLPGLFRKVQGELGPDQLAGELSYVGGLAPPGAPL